MKLLKGWLRLLHQCPSTYGWIDDKGIHHVEKCCLYKGHDWEMHYNQPTSIGMAQIQWPNRSIVRSKA